MTFCDVFQIRICVSSCALFSCASKNASLSYIYPSFSIHFVPKQQLQQQQRRQKSDASGHNGGFRADTSPPAAVVLFPDLLPTEVIPLPSALALASGGAAAAVWGSVEAVRAVLVPQDTATPVRTVLSLDLSVAEASMAAAAAIAADHEGLDRFQIAPEEVPDDPGGRGSPLSLYASGNGAGNRSSWRLSRGSAANNYDLDNDDDDNRYFATGGLNVGFGHAYKSGYTVGVRAAAEKEKSRRATLLAEAIANALHCDRESVVTTRLACQGMDICSVRPEESASPFVAGSNGATPNTITSGGDSTTPPAAVGAADWEPDAQWRGAAAGGSTIPPIANERASALAGKRLFGDVLLLLEGGGVRHGAAGVEFTDTEDGHNTKRGGN